MAKAERWAPLPIPVDVFLIALETTEDLKNMLGATSVRVAYNRGGTILVEWTMMHREQFAGFVGEYVVRKSTGELIVMPADELMSTYAPWTPPEEIATTSVPGAEKLGKVLAVYNVDGVVQEAVYELPDGTPATFVRKTEEEAKVEAEAHIEKVKPAKIEPTTEQNIQKERPTPGPPKQNNKENNRS